MILKNSFSGIAVLLFFLTFSQVGMAGEEVPLLPMTVEGVALINGTSAPIGTVIEAYLNGEQVGKFLVNTSSGDYCFWISGTAENEGEPITFTVNGKSQEKILTWESGKQILSLQLSLGTEVDSGSYIESLTSKINPKSLTEIEKPEALGKNLRTKVIEGSVPEPNVKVLKNMGVSSLEKGAAKSAEDSSGLKSAPGFPITYAIAGIVMLVFGFNLIRE